MCVCVCVCLLSPIQATPVLAEKLWRRVHAKCWDLVGPMLNFSHHTAVTGHFWNDTKPTTKCTLSPADGSVECVEEDSAAAPGFVSAEFLLVYHCMLLCDLIDHAMPLLASYLLLSFVQPVRTCYYCENLSRL